VADTLTAFDGAVRCERGAAPLGLTLRGRAAGAQTALAFSADAPQDLPATLEDVLVTQLAGGGYRITGAGRAWELGPCAAHLSREAAPQFYRVLPPRPVPLRKRLLWRAVLALAASRAGLMLLRALR
jgi:hypothetical protein